MLIKKIELNPDTILKQTVLLSLGVCPQTLTLQHQRLIFRAASPLDLRGKENVYLMDEKAKKPPTGKTKYRFVTPYCYVFIS